MNDEEAVAALKRLGLTTYEARVFVALQKLGTGTASEVAEVADVPRSQVYGAADDLEARGLVDVEQSNPTRYRPVDAGEARQRLYRQLRSESDAAFDYLETVQAERQPGEESESIWTVRGRENVASRAAELLASADDRAVYGSETVEAPIREALAAAVDAGAAVTVLSEDADVLDVARDVGARGVQVRHPPAADAGEGMPDVGAERVVMVDDGAVLVSVIGEDGEEAAFWSRGTAFASMLSTLLSEFTASVSDDAE
ncbi:TrmB family transcriptional regulator [Halobacterium yunchengense]|uniref:TrmB family transcriptional regulator n=1 Tax=Halobacterium yunchengense TaxID=3108497 RepID=UPI003008701B